MSRIDKQLVNPAQKFFNWSGDHSGGGFVQYYDKEAKENIKVDMPFGFMVLDRVFKIGGGRDVNGTWSGFWSNTVQDLKSQPFFVKAKEGQVAHGLYADIKGTPGVKFVTGLYIAYKELDGSTHIGFLELGGAAMSVWIDMAKSKNIYEGAFAITGSEERQKGSNKYFAPVIAYKAEISKESDDEAKALTVPVVEYLKAYFAAQAGAANIASDNGYPDAHEEYSGEPPMPEFIPSEAPDEMANADEIPF